MSQTTSVSVTRPAISRQWIWLFPLTALALVVLALMATGANSETDLVDAGALVRWGLPLTEVLHNFAMATTMGALLFAIAIVPRFDVDAQKKRRINMAHKLSADDMREKEYKPFTEVLNLASIAALTWTFAALAVLVFSYADISGRAISGSSSYISEIISYATTIDAGKERMTTVIIAAVVTTLTFGVRSLMGLFLTLAVSLIGIVDMALSGHSSGGDDHMGAVNSLGLHLLGVSIWCGGLITLIFIARSVSQEHAGTGTVAGRRAGEAHREPMAVAVVKRYSALALFGYIVVSVSGVVNAAIRMNNFGELVTTDYGRQILAKVALVLLLGIAGAIHRLRLIPRFAEGAVSATRTLWTVILSELVLMGAASGVAVSLSRTAPPVPETLSADASPVRIITWYDMPPEPHVAEWFTQWRIDWFWLAVILTLAYVYVWAYIRTRRAGDHWPVLRMASWLTGLALLNYLTSGALPIYGRVMFSAHMVEHMLLTMVVPIFLVLGAPVTLILKALEPRQDGTRGPREWILRLVHSGWSKVITHPIFAAVNFAGSIIVVYFTPLLGVMLRYHVGHEFMIMHFMLTGYIFMLVLIGIDPIPYRPAYPMRIIMLIATLGYHAFVGVALMGMNTLLEASWFGNVGRPWGLSAIDDQKLGGSLMWGIGEIPTMIIAVAVGVQWAIADGKLAKRLDRQAERDGDAELKAYNAMFEQLNENDELNDRP